MTDDMSRRDFGKTWAATACWTAISSAAPRLFAEKQLQWQRESSSFGALPVPSTSREQTGDTIARLDKEVLGTEGQQISRVTDLLRDLSASRGRVLASDFSRTLAHDKWQSIILGFVGVLVGLAAALFVVRWTVRPLKTELRPGLPGVGHPRWQIDLLRVKNGQAGSWIFEWKNRKFWHISQNYAARTFLKKYA